jgi:bacterioferritin (cytochrome b1)
MEEVKSKLAVMMNKALEQEHAARIQYLAHAEMVQGLNAEPIRERLKEIASDEAKHEEKFRTLISDYLGSVPCMGLALTHPEKDILGILKTNLANEKEAIDFYKQIYRKVLESKDSLPYEFETLEHEVRHVIIEEQEHVTELALLLGE